MERYVITCDGCKKEIPETSEYFESFVKRQGSNQTSVMGSNRRNQYCGNCAETTTIAKSFVASRVF